MAEEDAARGLDVSPFVGFFHKLPRFGFGNRLRIDEVYGDSIIAVVVPFLALTIFCLLFALLRSGKTPVESSLLSTSRLQEYGSVPNDADTADDGLLGAMRALRAGMFFVAAATAIAAALAANWHLWAGASTTLAVAMSSAGQLQAEAHGVLAVAEKFLVRLNGNPLLKAGLALGALSNFDPRQELQAVRDARIHLDNAATDVRGLANATTASTARVFFAVVLIVALLGGSLWLLFTQERGSLRTPALVAAVAWLLVAVATAGALVASDTCATLSEFRKVLLMQAGYIRPSKSLHPEKNVIIAAGVQCPHEMINTSVPIERMVRNFGLLLDNKLFETLLRYVYPSSSQHDRRQLRKWLAANMQNLMSCDLLISHAGSISRAFCERKGPMLALFAAWVALIGLAVTLTLAAVLPAKRDVNIWRSIVPPLPIEDGAIENDY